jgi:hypothetical protein
LRVTIRTCLRPLTLTLTVIIGLAAADASHKKFKRDAWEAEAKAEQTRHLAIARAEAVNMAIVCFVQAKGRKNAADLWATARTQEKRYAYLGPYLAFAPTEMSQYMPEGYALVLPSRLRKIGKVLLMEGRLAVGY